MTRTTRFLGGLSLGYANMALVTVAGLWLTPFFLHRMGQHDYGLWLVGSQIMAYLMLMDFGVVALLPRETAYATGRAGGLQEARDLPKIIGQTARLVLLQMPLVALAAIILWFSMPAAWEALHRPLGVIVLAFIMMFPLRILQAVLQGLQDLAFIGGVQIFTWLLSTTISVGLLLEGLGLYALAVGWVAGQVISTTLCWYRFHSRFPQILPRHLAALSWTTARDQLTRGMWVSVAQAAQVLLNGTDLLIIGKLLGPAAVVPYVCTGKLVGVLANQSYLLIQTAGPALSEMKTGEPHERLYHVSSALSQAMLIASGTVVCVVLTINQGFVSWWVGIDQYGGFGLTAMILLSMLLRHWAFTLGHTIFCFGYERRLALTGLLDGIVTTFASVVFVWLLGPIGAPLGSIMGGCLVSLPGNSLALTRETGVSFGTLLASIRSWCWRFLITLFCAYVIGSVWVPNTFPALVEAAILISLICFAMMLPIALRPPLRLYLLPQLTSIWVRIFGARRLSNVA